MPPPVRVVANKLVNRQDELKALLKKREEGTHDPRVDDQITKLEANLQVTRAQAKEVGIGIEWIKPLH